MIRKILFLIYYPIVYLCSLPFYKVVIKGKENVPTDRPYVIVPNHITWIDGIFILLAFKTPATWLAWYKHFYKAPNIFKAFGFIPTCSSKINSYMAFKSIELARRSLIDGWPVVVFPEGGLREEPGFKKDESIKPNGTRKMRRGYDYLRPKNYHGKYVIPVVPVTISNLWGSWLSRKDGEWWAKFPRFFGKRREVIITISEPMYEVEPDWLQSFIESKHPENSPEII